MPVPMLNPVLRRVSECPTETRRDHVQSQPAGQDHTAAPFSHAGPFSR
jgi:hypothetical protein